MISAGPAGEASEGLRERKRRETLRRISDAGLRLFTSNGFDATTVDAIAAEAGISRRTFFHYFKSKDDILLSLQSGLGEMVAGVLATAAPGKRPIDAAREALLALVAPYTTEDLIRIDRLMRSSEAVQARKQANYIRDEGLVLVALRRRWPEEPEASLRLVAMLTISLSRVSLDRWSSDGGVRPLATYLEESFAALDGLYAGR